MKFKLFSFFKNPKVHRMMPNLITGVIVFWLATWTVYPFNLINAANAGFILAVGALRTIDRSQLPATEIMKIFLNKAEEFGFASGYQTAMMQFGDWRAVLPSETGTTETPERLQ